MMDRSAFTNIFSELSQKVGMLSAGTVNILNNRLSRSTLC